MEPHPQGLYSLIHIFQPKATDACCSANGNDLLERKRIRGKKGMGGLIISRQEVPWPLEPNGRPGLGLMKVSFCTWTHRLGTLW